MENKKIIELIPNISEGGAETLVRLSSIARSLSKKSFTFFMANSVSLRLR